MTFVLCRNAGAQQRVGGDATHGPRQRRGHHPGDADAGHQAALALGRDARRHARRSHAHALARHAVARHALARHTLARYTYAAHARFHAGRGKCLYFTLVTLLILFLRPFALIIL